MRKEWLLAGGICFIVGLLFFLVRSFGDTPLYLFLYGSGLFIIGESLLVMFIGLAYPSREKH